MNISENNSLGVPGDPQERVVHEAYQIYAEKMRSQGFRTNWLYIAQKCITDWALLERVGFEGKDILNIGCAEPIDEMFYARKAKSWTATDYNPHCVETAKAIVKDELSESLCQKLSFKVADGSDLPFPDNSFDVAVSFSTIEHIPDSLKRKKVFSEMARVTRPGGHVVVTVSNAWSLIYRRGVEAALRNGTAKIGYECFYSPLELKREFKRVGLIPLQFASERRLVYRARIMRILFQGLQYFGARIGYCALKPVK